MAILNNNPLVGASGNQGGYNINNSLRFRSSATAYLSRTPSSSGNRQKWTWSGWVKRGALSDTMLFHCQISSTDKVQCRIDSNHNIAFLVRIGNVSGLLITSRVLRDPSAWYHIMFVCDTTQATATTQFKIYVNGVEETSFSSSSATTQNGNSAVNSTTSHQIGYDVPNASSAFDGYLAETYLIDGQALTPSSFGETDTTTGVWKPKAYTGTYGTNGFYLKFSDITTTSGSNAGLGKDFSGNSNYWTTNNISVTSGTTYDAMTDVPTNTSATVANYAVWNPLSPTGATCADGNLQATLSTSGKWAVGTFAVSSGKYYFECVLGGGTPELAIGIAPNSATTANSNALHYYSLDGKVYSSNSVVATGATFTSGDIIGVAFEPGGNAYFYKNNTLQATVSMPAGSDWCAETYQTAIKTNTATINFGQRPFTYTPPTGYVALNTYNLLTPTILQGNKYMDATLYTQNGAASNVVVNAGQFKPDLVWLKCRSNAGTWNNLVDSVRGGSKTVFSNSTSAELTDNFINTFNSNGFTLNIGDSGTNNTAGRTQVAWQWQAGQGSTSSGTGTGGITSVVQSVNTTAGFSIVTYTGSGANGTVTHGLGVAPAMVIVKRRNSTGNWNVRHVSITAANSLYLNLTNASQSDPTVWNSTVPTSTVFSIGTDTGVNASGGTYVAYCWADVSGYSKAFSYTGNGSSDGPFTFLGLRPKFVLIKRTDAVSSWFIHDTSRDTYNTTVLNLYPNLSAAEETQTTYSFDILSNGFKVRGTSTEINASGGTYIGIAFAENPFKVSLAR